MMNLLTVEACLQRRRATLAWIGAALLPAVAAAVPGGGTLHLAHQFPVGSIPDRAAQKFADLVASKSAGKLRIQLHPAASLGDERNQLSLLQQGKLDFALTGDLVIGSLNERYLVVSMPFLYRDAAHALAIYDGPLGAAIRRELLGLGLRALSWHHVGTRVLTANKPIGSLADLQGLVLRLPQDQAWQGTWRTMGARPVHVPFNELATALALGKVEAQENPPNFIRTSKLYEHQKYLILTNHLPQRQFIFASEPLWVRLPAAQRQVLAAAATEASRWTVAVAEAEQVNDLHWLAGEGHMKILPFNRSGVAETVARVPKVLAGEEGLAVFRQIVGERP